ncbi:MAG: VPLPA-CTERM sorting domain-containing protein [Steroidobacteraceae bacterium]|jgi:hypothetical protein
MNAKLLGVVAVVLLGGPTVAAADTIYDWSWVGGGINASGTVDVLNGYVQSATGTISGGGLPGSESLSLITAASPGVISNPDPANPAPGSFVFQTGGGDNFEGDTVWNANGPDPYGLVLAVGNSVNATTGAAEYAFNPWINSDGSAQASLAGNGGSEGRIYTVNQSGTFLVSAVPLPAALPLLLSGVAGLAGLARRRRPSRA